MTDATLADAATDTVVRRATTADAEGVAALLDRLMAEVSGLHAPVPNRDTVTIARRLLGLRDSVWGFVALRHGQPVGVAMVNECAAVKAGGLYGEITEIYVAPHCRSDGVGYALLGAVKRAARERGWTAIEVGPPPGPEWARTAAFLKREGFEPDGPRLRFTV